MTAQVVLATYNGLPYLPRQLDSLWSQTNHTFSLLVHDDGSDDGTVEWLMEQDGRAPVGFEILTYPPTGGAMANFSSLLERTTADYVFCCDQDDVWHPQKVEEMLRQIRFYEGVYGPETPILLHSDLSLIDSYGEPVAASLWSYQHLDPRWTDHFGRALTQNVVTGCAIVVNRALLNKALPVPAEAVMHDWWLAVVACAFGKVVWLDEPMVLYRQHGRNEVGAKKFDLPYLWSRVRQLSDRSEARQSLRLTTRQAAAFAQRYPNSPVTEQAQLYAQLSQMKRWRRAQTILQQQFLKIGWARNLAWMALT